jgi:hypothetical protein
VASVKQLGLRLDAIIANAGIGNEGGAMAELEEPLWDDMIAVNLTGVWKSVNPSTLIIFFDIYVTWFLKLFGFIKRNDVSWKTADEVTVVLC